MGHYFLDWFLLNVWISDSTDSVFWFPNGVIFNHLWKSLVKIMCALESKCFIFGPSYLSLLEDFGSCTLQPFSGCLLHEVIFKKCQIESLKILELIMSVYLPTESVPILELLEPDIWSHVFQGTKQSFPSTFMHLATFWRTLRKWSCWPLNKMSDLLIRSSPYSVDICLVNTISFC